MSLRTVTLPVNPGATLPPLPPHDVQDVLPYVIDCTAWLDDTGTTLTGATVTFSPDPLLTIAPVTSSGIDATNRFVEFLPTGGTAGTTAAVGVRLALEGGEFAQFVFSMPIYDRSSGLTRAGGGTSSTIPAGAIADAGGPIIDASGYLIAA